MDRIGSLIDSTRATLISARDHYQDALDYQRQGNWNGAQVNYLKALDIAHQVHRINSTKADVTRTLAQINQDYAGLLEKLGRYADAQATYRRTRRWLTNGLLR